MDETQAVGTQDNPVSTSLIHNGPGRTAMFWEVGPEFRLFDNPLFNVHQDKSYLAPVFSIAGGVRKNGRFQKFGDLIQFKMPEWRQFYRFSVSLNKVVDRRAEGEDPKSFAVALAVEYERPLNKGTFDRTVPAGTRIVLTASFDVLAKLSRAEPKK